MTSNLVGILLAAGASSRFGGNKLLHPMNTGVPIGIAAARRLVEAIFEAVAVVRPEDSALPPLLAAEGLSIVVNERATEGLGASVACGVRAQPRAQGWIVGLADMPYIQAATIRLVADRLRNGAAIAAPAYNGRRGHPVGFSARFFSDLTQLQGDRGARDLIERHVDSVELIEVKDRGILKDVDYRDDSDQTQTPHQA